MARMVRKAPEKAKPVFSPGRLVETCGAAWPMRTLMRIKAPIHEYFSNVWMMAKPKTEIMYEMTEMMTQPTLMVRV